MQLSDIINFSNYSLVFSLYLIIAVNFLSQTFSCHVQDLLQNMYVKHLVGIFTLFFFVLIIKNKKTDDEYLYFKNILSTIFLYVIFICSLRINKQFFIVFITIICINFGIRGYIESLNPSLFDAKIKKLEEYSKYLTICSVLIIFIGIILYYIEKKKQYGKNFNNIMFFIGNKDCNKFKI